MSDTVPTDSVLRRHHEAARKGADSDTVPTDSVLRRHHEAARKIAQGAPAETRTPEPAAVKPDVREPAEEPAQEGGFVGWLKRLFCG